MDKNFTHIDTKINLNFNSLDLAVSCEILERERERERERDAPGVTNHFFNKTKFLLCQNDGVVFLVSILQLIYTNLLSNRLYSLCKAALLLFCCRSEYVSCISLSYSRLFYTVKCRECTLLFLLVRIIAPNINNKGFVTRTFKQTCTNLLSNRLYSLCKAALLFCCRSESDSCISLYDSWLSYTVKCRECILLFFLNIITRNINNKRVSDPQMNNNEKDDSCDALLCWYGIASCPGRH